MQAPKNGFFYVLDRRTGEFLSGTPYVAMNWATGIDQKGRPIINPEARYGITGKPMLVTPGPLGGHNWQPMSFSPVTGLVYIPGIETAFPYQAVDPKTYTRRSGGFWNIGLDPIVASIPHDEATRKAVACCSREPARASSSPMRRAAAASCGSSTRRPASSRRRSHTRSTASNSSPSSPAGAALRPMQRARSWAPPPRAAPTAC